MKKTKENGVTLIALVVTIIILLILASTSILLLTGDNGILKQASRAKTDTAIAQKEEEKNLEELENIMYENTTSIEVEQTEDKFPGVLEKENEDTFVINSIEDLVFFAYDVRNGNSYEGKNVKLGISLDFKSSKSYVEADREDYLNYGYNGNLKQCLTNGTGFISIGETTRDSNGKANYFAGNFDGDNKIINNLYMNMNNESDSKNYYLALFGYRIDGKIENLKLTNVDITLRDKQNSSACTGLVCCAVKEGVEILNCSVSGKISHYSSGKGDVNCSGIIAYNNSGMVSNCSNFANIHGEIQGENTEASCYVGGVAVNQSHEMENCFNAGDLTAIGKKGDLQVGGVSRILSVDNSNTKNCFNKGTINVIGNQSTVNIGGITSLTMARTKIENAYNVGKIVFDCTDSQIKLGGLVGYHGGDIENSYNIGKVECTNLNNCNSVSIGELIGWAWWKWTGNTIVNTYYSKNNGYEAIGANDSNSTDYTEVATEDFTNGNLVNKLNNTEYAWKQGKSYPILDWE